MWSEWQKTPKKQRKLRILPRLNTFFDNELPGGFPLTH